MISDSDLQLIVSSYELSPKKEQKVLYRAQNALKDRRITTFDQAYIFISDTIDSLDHFRIRNVSLDVESFTDSKITRIEQLHADGYIEQSAETPISDFYDRLRDHLPKEQLEFLQTLHLDRVAVPISSEELDRLLPDLERRIDEIQRQYSHGGKILLPARPIRQVFLNPLNIRYGHRHYNGDPLKFVEEHKETYAGMTPSDLVKFDLSLYRALLAAGQTDQIPRQRRILKDPLKYLRDHPELQSLTRGKLVKADIGLYSALQKKQLLSHVPRERRELSDPLTIRNQDTELQGLTRGKLRKADQSLYEALIRRGQIDEIPRERRDLSDPLKYLDDHPELKRYSRGQLRRADQGLYSAFQKKGLLDAIPRKTRDLSDPIQYINDHPELKGLSRGQLKKADPNLYASIREKGLLAKIPLHNRPSGGKTSTADQTLTDRLQDDAQPDLATTNLAEVTNEIVTS